MVPSGANDREQAELDFPGYSIIGEIGRGGMATVYRARQVMLDREVALKVLIPTLAADLVNAQRFLQEARMLASLEHPNVVPVYEVGATPSGLHYFSMQLLENGDFAARLREGVSEVELVRVLAAVASALGYAHTRGYVHRDVTPANILFDADDTPRLTDFGIARALAVTSRITASGLSVGTSHYMSPEQARGGEVDPRSDIYSLGIVCYQALIGEPPFDGEDAFAVAYAHVHEPMPMLPEALATWQPLIDRCVAKNPDERFQDCQEFIASLRTIARGLGVPDGAGVLPGASLSGGVPAVAPIGAAGAKIRANPASSEHLRERSAPRWSGPLAGLIGLLLVLALFAWRPWAGTDVPSGSPDEVALASASDSVETLLADARQDIADSRFTSPPGRNALDRYVLVLRAEPGNAEARAGIEQVAATYLTLADQQSDDEDPSLWLGYLQRAEEIASRHGVGVVVEAADMRRRARLERIMRQAREALSAWDGERAVLAYERALMLAPGSPELTQELAQARTIGRDGFVFNDPVAGGNGPEMIVRGPLAWARAPVTLGEFSHYWQSVGAQRFGALPANCRDRESRLRPSRKRTFLDPGFPQNEHHPVVCVTAAMADDYARWLSQGTGKAYRVPTGEELARIGIGSADDCGANLRDAAYRAQFGGREGLACNDGQAATSPVTAFAAAQNGLRDTGGNVREWTTDCVGGACRERIVIGAGWASPPGDGAPRAFPSDAGFNTIGFRVVREIQ